MKNATFPEVVQRKSCMVTIYRTLNRGQERFTLAFYDASGQRRRQTFAAYATAKQTAEKIARDLSDGGLDLLTLQGKERYVYEHALELLKPTGLALDLAILQLVEASSILHGMGSIVDAAKLFVRHQQFA